MLATLAMLAAPPAAATILQFDQTRNVTGTLVQPTGAGSSLPQDYGDRAGAGVQNVTGGQFTFGEAGEGYTPNVSVDYFMSNATAPDAVQMWTTQYGDLNNVIFGLQGSNQLNIRLTADAGFLAQVYRFDLAGWPTQNYSINGVSVFGNGTSLFEQQSVLVNGAGGSHTSFEFATPLSASELLIRIDYSNIAASQQDNIGFDNLRFGQTPPPVPEPATWAMLAAGLAGLLLVRRRAHW